MSEPIRVVMVRGHQLTPWELGPWEQLPPRFSVACLETPGNRFDAGPLQLERVPVRTRRDRFPRGALFDLAFGLARDRYVGLEAALGGADVVHAEELGYWFSADVAERRRAMGFRLVQTVWETLPLLDAYRNARARESRRKVLESTDLFLAATERARAALLLEGVAAERIEVCPPGIDTERFSSPPAGASAGAPDPEPGPPGVGKGPSRRFARSGRAAAWSRDQSGDEGPQGAVRGKRAGGRPLARTRRRAGHRGGGRVRQRAL